MKDLNIKECTILNSANVIFFDVDDTLILWDSYNHRSDPNFDSISLTPHENLKGRIIVEDPYMPGHMMSFRPHVAHCHILIRNKNQGRTIVVWSAAGHAWASTVVKALGLEEYVSLIMEKPKIIVDDTPFENWHPQRIYLSKDTESK
jgi:FMN phosphatase YigB (HAD superfamily)